MARSILLPTRAVRPMSAASLDLLDETATHARAIFSVFVRLPPSGTQRLLDATMAFMRRWSVEIVLVVGDKGSATFGGRRDSGPSQSPAPQPPRFQGSGR